MLPLLLKSMATLPLPLRNGGSAISRAIARPMALALSINVSGNTYTITIQTKKEETK